jgi:methionine sulfoxide reductase catalytic subunit
MPLRRPITVWSEVTPKSVYLNRRKFLAGAMLAAAARRLAAGTRLNVALKSPFSTSEQPTPFDAITHYNNFYEFGTDKDQPARLATDFKTSPWTVSVEGAVNKPRTFDLDMLMKLAPLEERIYRHRCVEGWSIVVPWIGFPLNALIKQVEPLSSARFVAFQSFFDRHQMPRAQWAGIAFPYVEGLRIDEAMHPLTLLAAGLYGEVLPNQDGAPIRLVVPWKYGFKSIKSIVKIRFVEKQPPTTWNLATPREYGFYSNVNPTVDHPRWSQSKERRLGEFFKRPTLMFNGYGDQVASLYAGMDLRKNY